MVMSESRLQAAAVQVDITPPVGTGFDGYMAREGASIGVHDPLLAQLVLLQSGEDRLVCITMDLLGVSLDFTRQVRAQIEGAIGVPQEHIMVSCTHTHSGATGFWPHEVGIQSAKDPELQAITRRKLVGAAIWARELLQPARLGVGLGRVQGIGRNRNDPEGGAVDDQVVVLRVDAADGQPLAVMMNYGCHPTVLGYKNLLFSADYPGAARQALKAIYPETVFLYTNGASGDISTRFTRRDQSFAEVERMGRILAGEVLKVMQWVETQDMVHLGGRIAPIELPFRTFPPADAAEREIKRLQADLKELQAKGAAHGDIRIATTRVEGAMMQAELAKTFAGRSSHRTELQTLQVAGLALVGLPGEPFTRTVLEIKEQSPHAHTAVVSYSNDECGYFPDAWSIAAETYEALSSPYAADVAEILKEVSLGLLGGR
jgi:neutral ceramidase